MSKIKATGLIRSFDDLGRIIIPREIRKKLNITDKDSAEIFITDNNEILLRKMEESQTISIPKDLLEDLIQFLEDLKYNSLKELKKYLQE